MQMSQIVKCHYREVGILSTNNFFSDCLPISQSMKYSTDSSRNFMQFLVCHPGQTSVTDNRGGHDQGVLILNVSLNH